jgi:endonuclease YncB( thermonuclease family)
MTGEFPEIGECPWENDASSSYERRRLDRVVRAASPALSEQMLVGPSVVIDGDTLEIRGQRIRLFGIDAPEIERTCAYDGVEAQCGQRALIFLSLRVAKSAVRCDSRAKHDDGTVVAKCYLDGEDLAAWLVLRGYAIADPRISQDYVDEEEIAKANHRELWRRPDAFVPPWVWRARHHQHGRPG